MNNNLYKEKKNIVADTIYSELVGKTVNMSTLKGDYEDVLIHQYDQYTLIVEIDGNHFLLSKSAIVDIQLPEESVATILGNIDSAFKAIEFKKEQRKQPFKKTFPPRQNKPEVTVQVKQRRSYNIGEQ